MIYLINFVLCSGLLLAVYKLLLLNERMYRFNRFYLLFSLVMSAVIPFVVINTKTETIPIKYQQVVKETIAPVFETAPAINADTQTATIEAVNYLPMILIGGYVLITAILILRATINLYKINKEVKVGQYVTYQQSQLVLTNADVTPHSFLRYIFISRKDYENGLIEPQVICHEQAHVRQWHSLDVLFIEFLQALCWFNPFIPLYRKAIQLNHEFLADEAVTEVYEDTPAYQYLLLARASQQGSLQLTSQFNYQTTKKRLIMMTKTTPAKIAISKMLMMVPVAAMAVLLFSEKTQAKVIAAVEKKINTVVVPTPVTDTPKKVVMFPMPENLRVKHAATDAPQSVLDEYATYLKKYDLPGANGSPDMISAEDKVKMKALFVQMSAKQQDAQLVKFRKAMKPVAKNKVTDAQLTKWQNKDFGVWIDGKRVNNADLANYKGEDFDHMWFSNLTPLARKNDGFKYQVDLMTKAGYADYYKKRMDNQGDQIDVWHVMPKRVKTQTKAALSNIQLPYGFFPDNGQQG